MSINVLLHHYKIHTKTKKNTFHRTWSDRPARLHKGIWKKKQQMEFHYQGSLFICSTKSARYAACREHIKWRSTANSLGIAPTPTKDEHRRHTYQQMPTTCETPQTLVWLSFFLALRKNMNIKYFCVNDKVRGVSTIHATSCCRLTR